MDIKSKYFKIQELVSPKILDVLTEEAAWKLIPYGVINGLDNLRRTYGAPIWINGKGFTQSGIREKFSTTGAPRSNHKLYTPHVCAFDLKCEDLNKLLKIIMDNNIGFGIVRIENPDITIAGGWIHIEISDQLQIGELQIFNP